MRSAEFRAFAQKWLGFDPADEDDLMCFELTVKINHPVTYSLVRAAIGQS